MMGCRLGRHIRFVSHRLYSLKPGPFRNCSFPLLMLFTERVSGKNKQVINNVNKVVKQNDKMLIIVIGARADEEVYGIAQKRIQENDL